MGMMHACMHEWQVGLACGLRWVRLVVVVLMYVCICYCVSVEVGNMVIITKTFEEP